MELPKEIQMFIEEKIELTNLSFPWNYPDIKDIRDFSGRLQLEFQYWWKLAGNMQ